MSTIKLIVILVLVVVLLGAVYAHYKMSYNKTRDSHKGNTSEGLTPEERSFIREYQNEMSKRNS